MPPPQRSLSSIFLFWLPLAATWVMMAAEGPFLAAVIARLSDPTFNLAAYGVVFSVAILVESPVIMLMSAATALVDRGSTYRRLRTFMWWLTGGSTAFLLVLLIPGLFQAVVGKGMALPSDITELVYGALWIMLPWPAAIGYRRFRQGILIRAGRTRLVAYGTAFRLGAMAVTALTLLFFADLPGAWVGAAALSMGVVVEALAAHAMAMGTVRELLAFAEPSGAEPTSYAEIFEFYYPLALTSLIGLTLQPILTLFMGRAPDPIQSLAVFPVVHSLSFVFRSMGLAYVDVVIALVGDRLEHLRELVRFTGFLVVGTTLGIGLVAFTPLFTVWFRVISGLTPELAAFAVAPTRISVVLPSLSVALYFMRGLLVVGRRTRPVTVTSAIEIGVLAALFAWLGWGVGLTGAVAAFLAMVGGRIAGDVFLFRATRKLIRERRETGG